MQPLLDLTFPVLCQHKCGVTYVYDKRFLLALMFLEYAVESFYYECGEDCCKARRALRPGPAAIHGRSDFLGNAA